MQDTAEGFGQPIRQMFEPFFRMERELPTPFDDRPRYCVSATDHVWHWLYLPIARAAEWVRAASSACMQHGRISRLPDLQLRHAARAAVLRAMSASAMNLSGLLSQLLQVAIALAARAAAGRLGQPVPRVAANKRAPPLLLPYRTIRKLFAQGCGGRAERVADVPRHAVHRVRRDVLRRGHRAVARDRPAVRARRRRDRAGRAVRAGARVHRARRDGHRHGVRLARRAPRDVRSASSPSRRC